MSAAVADPKIAVPCSQCGTLVAPRPIAVAAAVVAYVVEVDEQGRCSVCQFLAGS